PGDREKGGVSCPDTGDGTWRAEHGPRPRRGLLWQAGTAAYAPFPGPVHRPAGAGTVLLAVGLGLRGDGLDEPGRPGVGPGNPRVRGAAENPRIDLRGNRPGM